MDNKKHVEISDNIFTVSMLIYSAAVYDYYTWWFHSEKSDHLWALSAQLAIWIMTFVTYTSDIGILIFLVRNTRRLVVKKQRKLIRQKTRAWLSGQSADSPWTTAIYVFMGVLLANVPISCLGYVLVHAIFYATFATFLTDWIFSHKMSLFRIRKKANFLKRFVPKFKKSGP